LDFIIGPLIGGVFAEYGIRVPFFIAGGLSMLNFIYGYFILPESLDPENRRDIAWKRANPIGSLLHLKKHGPLLGLAFSFFLAQMAGHSLQATWTFFTMLKFDWNEAMVVYSLALVGVIVAVVQAGLVQKVVKWIGQRKTVYLGFLFWTIGMIFFAFAPTGFLVMLAIVPYCLGGVAGPTVQSIVSNHVPANEQGELQGAMTSLISVAAIFGPLIMTSIFYYFTNDNAPIHFPGSPYILGSVLFILGLLFAIPSLRRFEDLT
jgi:DHA1 family tetracycline resistance protein-like MFS transporter